MLRKFLITLPFIILGYSFIIAQPGDSIGTVMVNAEEMPYWSNCVDAEDIASCTDSKLHSYISKHMKYPKSALEQEIEGKVIISCIINEQGKIMNPNIISDIGGGCGTEALRIVKNMPLWQPAKENGRQVGVVYSIEIPFIIDEHTAKVATDIIYDEPMKPIIEQPKKPTIPNNENEEKQLLPSDFTETGIGRVYSRVAQMPYFIGCENKKDRSKEKRACSNEQLLRYLKDNIKYPESAKTKGIEGIVYISFVVDENGHVLESDIKRNIGGGCGEEALRVVSEMPSWEPGLEKGKPVKTQMSLPVRFFLSAGHADKYKIHWGALRGSKITESQIVNSLREDLVVRDQYGDDITISTLEVSYLKGKNIKSVVSNGSITLEMMRLMRKAKIGGKLAFTVTIQEKGKMMDVYKEFDIIK